MTYVKRSALFSLLTEKPYCASMQLWIDTKLGERSKVNLGKLSLFIVIKIRFSPCASPPLNVL